MPRLSLAEDIRPISEFRSRSAELIDQVRSSGRPLVLTQRGRSAAVLLSVSEYEELRDEIELLRNIKVAEEQIERGQIVPLDEAREQILSSLRSS